MGGLEKYLEALLSVDQIYKIEVVRDYLCASSISNEQIEIINLMTKLDAKGSNLEELREDIMISLSTAVSNSQEMDNCIRYSSEKIMERFLSLNLENEDGNIFTTLFTFFINRLDKENESIRGVT